MRKWHRTVARHIPLDQVTVTVIEAHSAAAELFGDVVDSPYIPGQRVESAPETINERPQFAPAEIRGHRLNPDTADEREEGLALWDLPVPPVQRLTTEEPSMAVERLIKPIDDLGDMEER